MDAGEVVLASWAAGAPIETDGAKLILSDALAPALAAEAVRWRRVLVSLLSLPVAALCEGITTDEREAFEERAGILEHFGGYPRDLAERVAVWWARTPCCEREAA